MSAQPDGVLRQATTIMVVHRAIFAYRFETLAHLASAVVTVARKP